MIRVLFLLTCSLFLSNCAFLKSVTEGENQGPNYGKTLADLEPVPIPAEMEPAPVTTIDTIEDSYRSALKVAIDPDVRHRILTRLGDLEMARAEQRQLSATEQAKFFDDAIDMYRELLVLNTERQGEPGTPTNERLLYQLSKAYALDGRMEESGEVLATLVEEFPESKFAAEAEFRRAEKAFSEQDYEQAETLYANVMAEGEETPFYLNAVYMHGWSLFKRNRYRAALRPFTEVLDFTIKEGQDFESLNNSERRMATDTLRVLSIAFSYLDGAESITEVYEGLGVRHYQYRIYMALGELFFEKRRFRDSADTYRHYVKQFPNTDQAPTFSVKAIDVYIDGGFPSEILPAKQEYVDNYGVYSQFWQDRTAEERSIVVPTLKVYLDELSSYYHARAIELEALNREFDQKVAAGEKVKKSDQPEASTPDFIKAASLYAEYILTFPEDTRKSEMTFLMGEALYSAGKLAEAVKAYEKVAYEYLDEKRGAEAGFSAILTLQQLTDNAARNPQQQVVYEQWRDQKIESAITFADYYPGDERSLSVLTEAAQEIFNKNNFERAIKIATRITLWQPEPPAKLKKSAWLILAHSHFDLENYPAAEVAYQRLLSFLPPDDQDRSQIKDRVAAAIYKQAEKNVADGEMAFAVERLLSIREVAPTSAIAASGQYDAANYLIELKDWAAAERVLLDFKTRYPGNPLATTLAPKFALIYQESQQWEKAAGALREMSQSAETEEERRQALYLSAELYQKSGRINQAIDAYRDYANRYTQPFGLVTEARYQLVTLYEKTKQESKRNYWLQELIEGHKKAGSQATARSRYLAAFASAEFADDEFQRYEAVKLTLPLKQSLKRKKSALNKTLESYRDVMEYGVAEFATLANHQIGKIYIQLSRDLMDSERPNGLDALALDQYEILLEEQALPFEEKAIEILASNAERSWKGIYDKWVQESFATLAKILPARYGKQEKAVEFSDVLF